MSNIEDSSLPPASILAVDDHPANLLALEAIFEPLDIELVKAASGPQALKLAEERPFAVILLDVVMPEMDGFEVLDKLRTMRLASETPIILLTAYEFDPRNIESLQGAALVDYIVKPIASGLLRAKVRALVSLYRRGEALAARDRDIAMLAHDLQTPLASIAAGTLLLSRGDLDERTRVVTERIARTVKRMSDMVTDLTDYARAGLGPIPVVRRPVDLGRLATDVVAECQALEGGDRVRVEATGDLSGEWDPNRVAQAISNLVRNAITHGEGEVRLRLQGARDVVEVHVHNKGEPIPPDRLPFIFQPFERGSNEGRGLGLGLYIVRAIASAHGGRVEAISSGAEGTTFRLCLPRRLAA
ncbi:MAG TPA: hybrid sensor histidine kinase/response regulator [Polyangia bacterium]|nr:hybrid sensor histidine kinase/response regulator [Polyangia bacterium]